MKSISAHAAPHLPVTAATLMQILKRVELAGKPCIAMAMQTGRNSFFIDRHCRLDYSECNACDIKREGSQEENQTPSNSLKSDRKSSKTRLEKVVLFYDRQLARVAHNVLQMIRDGEFSRTLMRHRHSHNAHMQKYIKTLMQTFALT